jgi:type II restriction enzyme
VTRGCRERLTLGPRRGAQVDGEAMDLSFQVAAAVRYVSGTQRARVLTEHWVSRQVYCPNCGCQNIERYANNSRVADFYCAVCRENYELKGYRRAVAKIVDGHHGTMIGRLMASDNPNLLLLGYDHRRMEVRNLLVIPKQFFVPAMIEERKPLAPTARRAGWIGCNIRIDTVPDVGKIFFVRDGAIEPPSAVIARWRATLFLRHQTDVGVKGWLLAVMRCIDRIDKSTFSLREVYEFEHELHAAYPENRNIRAKIRQQLQVLRNSGYPIFLGGGFYRLAPAEEQNVQD